MKNQTSWKFILWNRILSKGLFSNKKGQVLDLGGLDLWNWPRCLLWTSETFSSKKLLKSIHLWVMLQFWWNASYHGKRASSKTFQPAAVLGNLPQTFACRISLTHNLQNTWVAFGNRSYALSHLEGNEDIDMEIIKFEVEKNLRELRVLNLGRNRYSPSHNSETTGSWHHRSSSKGYITYQFWVVLFDWRVANAIE